MVSDDPLKSNMGFFTCCDSAIAGRLSKPSASARKMCASSRATPQWNKTRLTGILYSLKSYCLTSTLSEVCDCQLALKSSWKWNTLEDHLFQISWSPSRLGCCKQWLLTRSNFNSCYILSLELTWKWSSPPVCGGKWSLVFQVAFLS